jgi:hypothetical protein
MNQNNKLDVRKECKYNSFCCLVARVAKGNRKRHMDDENVDTLTGTVETRCWATLAILFSMLFNSFDSVVIMLYEIIVV